MTVTYSQEYQRFEIQVNDATTFYFTLRSLEDALEREYFIQLLKGETKEPRVQEVTDEAIIS